MPMLLPHTWGASNSLLCNFLIISTVINSIFNENNLKWIFWAPKKARSPSSWPSSLPCNEIITNASLLRIKYEQVNHHYSLINVYAYGPVIIDDHTSASYSYVFPNTCWTRTHGGSPSTKLRLGAEECTATCSSRGLVNDAMLMVVIMSLMQKYTIC